MLFIEKTLLRSVSVFNTVELRFKAKTRKAYSKQPTISTAKNISIIAGQTIELQGGVVGAVLRSLPSNNEVPGSNPGSTEC